MWKQWRKLIAEIIFDTAVKAADLVAKNISDSAESARYERFAGQAGKLGKAADAGQRSLSRTERRIAKLKEIEEQILKSDK